MSKSLWLIACFVWLCSYSTCAQVLHLSIENLFHLADSNSTSLEAYRSAELAATENSKAAKSQWYPEVNIQAAVSYIGNGQLWNRNFGDLNHVAMPHFGNNLSVEVNQIIYSGGAIGSSVKLANLEEQIAVLNSRKQSQEVRYLLLGHYLDLYKLGNQKQVLEQNIDLTYQMLDNMHARLREGTALHNDITRYELQLEVLKLQLSQILDAMSVLNYQLVTTLKLPKGTIIAPDSNLVHLKLDPLHEQEWQEEALRSNISLKLAEIAVKMNEQVVRLERSAYIPKVAFVAADHLNGPLLIEVPVINKHFYYWYVGIGLGENISYFTNKI